jgi:hypothetical protein
MRRLKPLLSHSEPTVRKGAVMCIVEMRMVLGREFDSEISGLGQLPRRLVQHYLERRM